MCLHRMPNNLKFLEDFILPSLNDERYGDLLKWDQEETDCFLLKWMHKGGNSWSVEDTAVFQGWDILKGHHRPDERKYLCQAKQRFRSALYKLDEFEELDRIELNSKCYYKKYRIKRATETKIRKRGRKPNKCLQVPNVCNEMTMKWPSSFIHPATEFDNTLMNSATCYPVPHLSANENTLPRETFAEKFQEICAFIEQLSNNENPQIQLLHSQPSLYRNVKESGMLSFVKMENPNTDISLHPESLTQPMEPSTPDLEENFFNCNIQLTDILKSTVPQSPIYDENMPYILMDSSGDATP